MSGEMPASAVRNILWLLIAAALVYTLHRAYVLRIEYYDGYSYLVNARTILGDTTRYDHTRPPLLPLAELPGMLVVRASAPGSALRIVIPHCIAALTSVIVAAAVLMLFRRVFPPDLALLGTLLFVGSRFFVRYGAHVMADLMSAGCAAATIGAYLGARERPGLGGYVPGGVAFATALLTKFPLAALAPVLLAAEAWYSLRARRFETRRCAGIAVLVTTGVAVAALVQALLFVRIFGAERGLGQLAARFGPRGLRGIAAIAVAFPGESWLDWGEMALVMLGPVLPVAAAGLGVALARREDRDVTFLAWLAVLGGAIVFGIGHNEARYLLPVVPAILYFAVRALEAAGARLGRSRPVGVAAAVLVIAMLVPGLRQAWLDRDPVFLADTGRHAALHLLAARGPQGALVWHGSLHTLHPQDAVLMRADEFFNTFHFSPGAVQYFIDEPMRIMGPSPLEAADAAFVPGLRDGDVILHAAQTLYTTATVPPGGAPPMEVWRIRRLTLARDGDRFVPDGAATGVELLPVTGDERSIRAPQNLGRWRVVAFKAGEQMPRRLADVTLTAGTPVSLGPGSGDADITQIVLGTVEREVIR